MALSALLDCPLSHFLAVLVERRECDFKGPVLGYGIELVLGPTSSYVSMRATPAQQHSTTLRNE